MTRFDVAVLSLRILALYFLLEIVRGLSQWVVILTGDWSQPLPLIAWLVPLALIVVLGVLLFWKAPLIARGLFPTEEPMSTANRPEIGALALKICGIALLANSIAHWNRSLDFQAQWSWLRALGAFFPGLIGVMLFLGATPIARRLFGAPVKPLAAPVLAHVQAVTFAVLGIWLLVTTLPDFGESLGERIRLGEWGRGGWAQLTLVLLGLALFLGGVGLSAFWYWIRNAGLHARPERPH
jgi:hypothetical protein